MAQYRDGTVALTNGSATVTGTNTLFSTEVTVGDIFRVEGEGVLYQVASITSNTVLTLAANYAGTTASGLNYVIMRDFTDNYSFPEISTGDRDWPIQMTQALRAIDTLLKDHEDRITALEP